MIKLSLIVFELFGFKFFGQKLIFFGNFYKNSDNSKTN